MSRQPGPAQAAHQQLGHGVEAVGTPDLRADWLAAGITAFLRGNQQLAMACQLLAIDLPQLRQGMIDGADGDHLHVPQGAALQR
ncbi:hypothetical protein D3C76_1472740 [compost metagenome]